MVESLEAKADAAEAKADAAEAKADAAEAKADAAEAKADVAVAALREAVLALLSVRGVDCGERDRARVLSCDDPSTLRRCSRARRPPPPRAKRCLPTPIRSDAAALKRAGAASLALRCPRTYARFLFFAFVNPVSASFTASGTESRRASPRREGGADLFGVLADRAERSRRRRRGSCPRSARSALES
ncbi:MAG: hypothetical protein R3A52_27905 [Polyangiales bacterium]